MAKQRNEPIGTCPCPVKGCNLIAKLFKYRSASDPKDPDAEKRKRFGGRLYLRCDVHGKYDGQDYILDNPQTYIEDERCPPKKELSAPVHDESRLNEAPEKPAAAPVPHQSSQATKAAKMGFGFFRQ